MLPIMDFAQNSAEVLVTIQQATNISLTYTSYDAYVSPSVVTGGKVSAPKTISSGSICKSEAIFVKLTSNNPTLSLQGRSYSYTYWGEGARGVCFYSEMPYYHGYNPGSGWRNVGTDHVFYFNGKPFSEFGGFGVNFPNNISSISKPIPEAVAKQYLYGISGIQFQLKDSSTFSVVYQCFVKGIGWLKCSSDGEENLYRHDKPISAFRMNLVPKTDKPYLINYWNRDVGTNHVD